ncbi:hypothetical protein [Cypionkella sinensis]|uniref:Uncharacterized protein n=1 Tax=Cypionkella sinensis TaxID=1756043 RepID=A0ABV7IYU2_9RHOB
MGLISSLAAPSGAQIQGLAVRPVARIAAQGGVGDDAHTARLLGGAELPAEANLRPVLPPAASEAIFKGLLPMHPGTAEANGTAIAPETEVDGISLDGIPYLNDGAVLLDDLPKSASAAPVTSAPDETAAAAMALVAAQPMRPEVEATAPPEQVLSEQAERAYQEEREISALPGDAPAEAEEPPAPLTDNAKPDHVDTRA